MWQWGATLLNNWRLCPLLLLSLSWTLLGVYKKKKKKKRKTVTDPPKVAFCIYTIIIIVIIMTAMGFLTNDNGLGISGPSGAEPSSTAVPRGLRQALSLAILAWRAHGAGTAAVLGGQRVVGTLWARVLGRVLCTRWAVVPGVTWSGGVVSSRDADVASRAGAAAALSW